jgi:Ca2+-binding RTX toxin-like protein
MTVKGMRDGRPSPARRRLTLALAMALLVIVVISAASVYGDVSHEGWPDTVVYKSHPDDENGIIKGTNRSDELLGGHGNDTIYGANSADVIWGDFKPCCQPARQHDRLHGGLGNDFIYSSHGTNDITGGGGNDTIHAHWGRGGTIDCGAGYDVISLGPDSKRHYKVSNCERTSFKNGARP